MHRKFYKLTSNMSSYIKKILLCYVTDFNFLMYVYLSVYLCVSLFVVDSLLWTVWSFFIYWYFIKTSELTIFNTKKTHKEKHLTLFCSQSNSFKNVARLFHLFIFVCLSLLSFLCQLLPSYGKCVPVLQHMSASHF